MKRPGEFKSRWTPEVDPNVSIEASLTDFKLKKRRMQLSLDRAHNLNNHILGSVFYDPDTMEIFRIGHLLKQLSLFQEKCGRSDREWPFFLIINFYLTGEFKDKF